MITRTIKETTREYDENGNLVRETVTETTEDDNTTYWPSYPYQPYNPMITGTQYITWSNTTADSSKGESNGASR